MSTAEPDRRVGLADRCRPATPRRPASATHAARLTAVVVLPTPPFWFAIAYTVPIRRWTLAPMAVRAGRHGAAGARLSHGWRHRGRRRAVGSPAWRRRGRSTRGRARLVDFQPHETEIDQTRGRARLVDFQPSRNGNRPNPAFASAARVRAGASGFDGPAGAQRLVDFELQAVKIDQSRGLLPNGPLPCGAAVPRAGGPVGQCRGRDAACGRCREARVTRSAAQRVLMRATPGRRGNFTGVSATLTIACRWRCSAGGVGRHGDRLAWLEAELGGRAGGGTLVGGVAAAAPGDEAAANPGAAALRTRRRRAAPPVARATTTVAALQTAAPKLGPFAHDDDVFQLARRRRALEELALARVALHKPQPAARQRDRERQAGEAGAGAEVPRSLPRARRRRGARARPASRRDGRRSPPGALGPWSAPTHRRRRSPPAARVAPPQRRAATNGEPSRRRPGLRYPRR